MLDNPRKLFDLPREIAYFNSASVGPLMQHTVDAGLSALKRRTAPWTITTADWFSDVERRRTLFAQLVGASSESIALVPATSYGLAIARRNLSAKPGQCVLILAEEYPTTVYAWRKFCEHHGCEIVTIQRTAEQTWTEAVLAALSGPIAERIAIAALPNVQWTDGALVDLPIIAPRLRQLGARLVVDASQSLGVMPFDFAAIRPDYLVAVGYKWLLGPMGLSYLYVADEHLQGEPLEENWLVRKGSDNFARLVDYQEDYLAGARRFDVGERSQLEVTPVANAALETILSWSVAAITATLAAKTGRIAREAVHAGLTVSSENARAPHMLGIRLPAERLAGAPGILQKQGVFVSVRGPVIRISPHVFNDDEDIDRLMTALRLLK